MTTERDEHYIIHRYYSDCEGREHVADWKHLIGAQIACADCKAERRQQVRNEGRRRAEHKATG
jgi:hypothetical protein